MVIDESNHLTQYNITPLSYHTSLVGVSALHSPVRHGVGLFSTYSGLSQPYYATEEMSMNYILLYVYIGIVQLVFYFFLLTVKIPHSTACPRRHVVVVGCNYYGSWI